MFGQDSFGGFPFGSTGLGDLARRGMVAITSLVRWIIRGTTAARWSITATRATRFQVSLAAFTEGGMASTIDIGDIVVLTSEFRDPESNGSPLVDPTGITCSVRLPDQSLVTYTYLDDANLTRTEAGIYRCEYTPTAAGAYFVRWQGTGAVIAAEEISFLVARQRV